MINLLCAGACDNLGILHLRPFSGLECRLAADKDLSLLPTGLLIHIRAAGCVLPVFVTVSSRGYQMFGVCRQCSYIRMSELQMQHGVPSTNWCKIGSCCKWFSAGWLPIPDQIDAQLFYSGAA